MRLYSGSRLNHALPAAAQSPSSSEDSNEDDDKDSKSEEESDSSDDTFVKDSYYSSSSVWRSYTTRGQVKGNKEGEEGAEDALLGCRNICGVVQTLSSVFVFVSPPGSQDSKDGLNPSTKGTDEDKPPAMPEETGKSKVASWLNQGLKTVSTSIQTRRVSSPFISDLYFSLLIAGRWRQQQVRSLKSALLPDSKPQTAPLTHPRPRS